MKSKALSSEKDFTLSITSTRKSTTKSSVIKLTLLENTTNSIHILYPLVKVKDSKICKFTMHYPN
jgi:chaperone required for assembly of F1-ATPase